MADDDLTVEEIVQSIRRSQIATLVCEGKDDVSIYRHLEERIGPTTMAILPCGGRTRLLEVYDRRDEFADRQVIFLADKDMWLYSGVPARYADIILTNGYSIENDVMNWDSVESLLTIGERVRYHTARRELVKWVAFQVEQYLLGREYLMREHVRRVIDMRTGKLVGQYCKEKGYEEPGPELVTEIDADYRAKIRGKTLTELGLVFLSSSKRPSKYSRNNLIEMSLRVGFNRGLEGTLAKVNGALGLAAEELRF